MSDLTWIARNENAVLRIFQDTDAQNPRDDDNLGTLAFWDGCSSLGQDHNYNDPADFLQEYNERNAIILTVHKYEHSGVTYSTCSFLGRAQHAKWDSGSVGFIYVEKDTIRKEWGVKRINKKLRNLVIKTLQSEIEVMSHWTNGDTYGYTLRTRDGEEDSCWGFYGFDFKDNGLGDHLGENVTLLDALDAAEREDDDEREDFTVAVADDEEAEEEEAPAPTPAPDPKVDLVGWIMQYEGEEMSEEDVVRGFQHLIDTGMAWQFQGSYGRMAVALIEAGHCHR